MYEQTAVSTEYSFYKIYLVIMWAFSFYGKFQIDESMILHKADVTFSIPMLIIKQIYAYIIIYGSKSHFP